MAECIQEVDHISKHSNYPMAPETERTELELARRIQTDQICPIGQTDHEDPPEDREKLPLNKRNMKWPTNNWTQIIRKQLAQTSEWEYIQVMSPAKQICANQNKAHSEARKQV